MILAGHFTSLEYKSHPHFWTDFQVQKSVTYTRVNTVVIDKIKVRTVYLTFSAISSISRILSSSCLVSARLSSISAACFLLEDSLWKRNHFDKNRILLIYFKLWAVI